MGQNFNFYIKKANSDLYKIYGDIELFDSTNYFGWFSLDCYFVSDSDKVTIQHQYKRYMGSSGIDRIEYGLEKIYYPGAGFGVNMRFSFNENRITIKDDSIDAPVVGGIGVYKKDSLFNDTQMAHLTTNTTGGGGIVPQNTYQVYTACLPYWATYLSSDKGIIGSDSE